MSEDYDELRLEMFASICAKYYQVLKDVRFRVNTELDKCDDKDVSDIDTGKILELLQWIDDAIWEVIG